MAAFTAIFLHGLGFSGRMFDDVAARLGDDVDCLALDLPGFGGTSPGTATTVTRTADAVVAAIAEHAPTRWLLVGHSMGGKIATVVAHRALAGEPGLFGLAGVVLLAGSPPSPEPLPEQKRAEMIGWAAGSPLSAAAARTFVDDNVGAALPDDLDALAIADLLRTSRQGWLGWLERGSNEDWSETVGSLDVPALIVSGGADGPLGADGQRTLNGPVYPRARFLTLPGAGHLLPWERPAEVASAIMSLWDDRAGLGPTVPSDWMRLFASERTSIRTRGILAGRAVADDPVYVPAVLDSTQLATLRLLADLVVPREDGIDLAARVEAQLADGAGDGWRPAELPSDVEAYRIGLDALADLADLSPEQQAARLGAVVDGTFTPPHGWSAENLSAWFEDARTDLVRQWLAHPATMARIGFDGYATGDGGRRLLGWQLLAAGEREAWEPA